MLCGIVLTAQIVLGRANESALHDAPSPFSFLYATDLIVSLARV